MKKVMFGLVMMLLYYDMSLALWGVGDIVHDPINLVENALTAARTLESNTNEILQINNQVQSYAQQAKHLVSIPMSYIEQVTSLYQEYNNVLSQAQGMAYTLKNGVAQFEQLYATGFQGNMPLMQRAQAMLGQIRAASQAATAATALFDRLCAQQATVTALQAVSQAAPGSLAATQASNQLLGVLAEQNGSLQQMQATLGRVQIGAIMQETVANEQAAVNASQWLQGYGTDVFRGPGQGQGPKLPD